MADDLPELRREMARLRGELDHLWQILGKEKTRLEQSPVLPLEGGAIFIRHGKEKPPLVLKAEQGQAAIYLNDPEGRPRGVFQVDEEGARLEIWNKEQQVVLSIGETPGGAGEIYVAGADGKPRAGLKVTPAGGVVSAQNPDGHVNALLIGKSDGGAIVVADADGHPLVEIAATNGQGTVTIKQASGAEAAALTSDEKGGALTIFDSAGRLLSSSNFPP